MIRKRVLGVGLNSATLLVEDADAGNACQVLRRINVSDWENEEIICSMKIYKQMQQERNSFNHVARVSTVLHQNTFLNIVVDYYEAGSMAVFLEKSSAPFMYSTVCCWLLQIAKGVKELHKVVSSCFYGLALDHVFIESFDTRKTDSNNSIPTHLRLGIPYPERSYISIVEETVSTGMECTPQYPSEVLENKLYHPEYSDIWHLGTLAVELLELARVPTSSYPSELKGLIEKMRNAKMEDRPSIEEVIRVLSPLAFCKEASGKEVIRKSPGRATLSSGSKVSQCARPLSSREVKGSISKKKTTTSDKRNAARDNGITQPNMTLRTAAKDDEMTAPCKGTDECPQGKNDNSNGHSISPRRLRGDNSDWHYGAIKKLEELELARQQGCGTQNYHGEGNAQESYLGRAALNDRQLEEYGRQGEQRLGSQRYIDAAEGLHFDTGTAAPFQFKRNDLHTGRVDPNTRVINQMLGDHPSASSSNDKSKKLNGSPPLSASATPTRLPSQELKGNTSVKKKKVSGRPKGFVHPPFSYAKTSSGVVPVFGKRQEEDDDWHSTGGKKARPTGKQASRKAESCLVSATDGVLIYTPFIQHTKRDKDHRSPDRIISSGNSSLVEAHMKDESTEVKEKNNGPAVVFPSLPSGRILSSTDPSNIASGKSSEVPNAVSDSPSPFRSSPMGQRGELTYSRQMRTPSPRVAPPLPLTTSPLGKHTYPVKHVSTFSVTGAPQHPAATTLETLISSSSLLGPQPSTFGDSRKEYVPLLACTPKRLPSSHNEAPIVTMPPSQFSSEVPPFNREHYPTSQKGFTPQTLSSEFELSVSPVHLEAHVQQNNSTRGEKHKHKSSKPQGKSAAASSSLTPAMMEWAVDSLRSSIRSLVKDRTRYGELMVEVAGFVRKSEEERLSVSENSKLVQRLQRKLQMDDNERTRDAAVSLCSQLVALEGLSKLIRDPQH